MDAYDEISKELKERKRILKMWVLLRVCPAAARRAPQGPAVAAHADTYADMTCPLLAP